ncbi:MAG: DUF3090 domain-containing protein [Acidimicrobiales bacterium]
MSSSFEVPEVDHFTAGTVGPPGQRVFYIQARHEGRLFTLRLEKTQVAALCRYFEEMLSDLPPAEPATVDMDLLEPVVPEWIVGSLGVTYDEDDDRVVIVAEELVEAEGEPAEARLRATRSQVAAFTRRGNELMAAGRPPCPLCGGPLDPEGHMCVRLNGHRDLAP